MNKDTLLIDSDAQDTAHEDASTNEDALQESQDASTNEDALQESQDASTNEDALQESQDASTNEGAIIKEDEKIAEEYVFEAPEGKSFDPELIAKFGELAGELGLSNAGANKLVNDMSLLLEKKQQQAVQQVQNAWIERAKADAEFGGEALKENLGYAKRALDTFGTPELTAFLNQTGAGNHPEIIRTFVKVGRMLGEDGVVKGNVSASSRSITDILYPNMKV
jgi:hypothetical protein